VYDLQQQLKEYGVDIKSVTDVNGYMAASTQPPHSSWHTGGYSPTWEPGRGGHANSANLYGSRLEGQAGRDSQSKESLRALPAFRTGCAGDNYLGLTAPDSVLSTIKGTSLSLFGMEIDLADFAPADWDESLAPASYEQFLAYAMNRVPKVEKVDLPATYSECETYANWFFRSINPYLPVLHKPDFFSMVRHHVPCPLKPRNCC
jgi:hypothetical protein